MTPTPDERRDDRYEIENKEIQSLLRDVAKRIGADMPDGWGFTLFLFSYAAPHTLALDDDCAGACECATCMETGDGEWCAAGWYEDNEYEEIHWRVSDEVTHWMPLPDPPTEGEK